MSLNTDRRGTDRPDTLDVLRSGTTGAVLLPDDSGYDAARTGFQTHCAHRPDVLVRAASVSDVSAAIRYAAAHDLPVGVLGSGHAGIITAMEIGLMPVATMYAGSLLFDGPDIRPALTTWARWAWEAPDEVTTSVALVPFPDTPDLPKALRGRHVLQLRVAHIGDPTAGERLIRPLRETAPIGTV